MTSSVSIVFVRDGRSPGRPLFKLRLWSSRPKYSVAQGSNLIVWHIDKMVNTYHIKKFQKFCINMCYMGLPMYFPEDWRLAKFEVFL